MKNKKKFLSVGMVLLSLLFVLTACSTTGPVEETSVSEQPSEESAEEPEEMEPEEPEEQPEKIIIGYNAYTDTVSFSKKITDNLIENAEKAGATILKADTEGDPTKALQNVDAFLAQGATVVVDSSWVVAAVDAVAKKCKENNIPCISIDIPVDDAYFFGVNNLEAGKVTGRAPADYIKENWDGELDFIVFSFNEATGEVVKLRLTGIVDAIREAGIEVSDDQVIWIDPQSSAGTIEAKQMGTDFLTAHPDAKKILFATVNDQSAQGFLSAVETSNRTDDCIIVSHGADDPGLFNLKEDTIWLGSTAYFPERYGDYIMQMILDLADGKELAKETYIDNVFIDRSNVGEYYPNN
jgi:ribose transport system substrate-binding protein